MFSHLGWASLLAFVLLTSSAFALNSQLEGSFPSIAQEPAEAYDRAFPIHLGVCLASEVRRRDLPREAGYGHIALYLRGACRDTSAAIPQLKVCEADAEGSESLVSVNNYLKNLNWVVTTGRAFAFHGGLAPNENLNAERFSQAVADFIAANGARGVQIHAAGMRDGLSETDSFAHRALGYDTATSFGRHLWCGKLPIPPKAMERIVAYLNERNRTYANNSLDYQWKLFSNNCAHLVHNALAAAGIWGPVEIDKEFPSSLLNIAVPGNEFVRFIERGNATAADLDPIRVFKDSYLRSLLKEIDWIPLRHGLLLETIPFHEKNELFDGGLRVRFLESPWKPRDLVGKFQTFLRAPEMNSLEANLRHFDAAYRAALKKTIELREQSRADQQVAQAKSQETMEFHEFLNLYQDYLDRQIADIERRAQNPAALPNKSRHSRVGNESPTFF